MLAWMYAVPVLIFWLNKGRFYYVAEAYPALIAMGCAPPRAGWRRDLHGLAGPFPPSTSPGVAVCGAYLAAVIVPIAPSGPLRDFALKNNGDLREEFGWDDLVRAIAQVRDSLPPDQTGQRANYGIVTGNYGEAGAIENLGGPYQLPLPIGLTNSFYLRSYPQSQPSTLIVVGW